MAQREFREHFNPQTGESTLRHKVEDKADASAVIENLAWVNEDGAIKPVELEGASGLVVEAPLSAKTRLENAGYKVTMLPTSKIQVPPVGGTHADQSISSKPRSGWERD